MSRATGCLRERAARIGVPRPRYAGHCVPLALPIGLKSISGGEQRTLSSSRAHLDPVVIALAILNKRLIRGLTSGLAGHSPEASDRPDE